MYQPGDRKRVRFYHRLSIRRSAYAGEYLLTASNEQDLCRAEQAAPERSAVYLYPYRSYDGGCFGILCDAGDIIMAEPDALIGFAGQRVIKQTVGVDLPEGFQRSEFLLEHGLIDMVVNRAEMKQTLSDLLKLFNKKAG